MAVLRRDKCITLRTDDLWLVVWRTTLQQHQPLAHVGTGASVVSVRWGSLSISTLHLGTLALAELCSGQGQPQYEDNLIPRPVSPVTLVSVPMKQRDYPLLFVSDSLFTHLPIIFTHNNHMMKFPPPPVPARARCWWRGAGWVILWSSQETKVPCRGPDQRELPSQVEENNRACVTLIFHHSTVIIFSHSPVCIVHPHVNPLMTITCLEEWEVKE